jgi:4-hydroxybenzoate polyprenyltransferase
MIILSRPGTWLIAPTAYMLGLFASGNPGSLFSFFQMLILSFPMSLFIYGINDIYDIETDRINKRKTDKFIFGISTRQEEVEWIKKVSIIAGLFVFASSLLSFNIIYISITLLFLLVIYSYSAPPIRIKSIPIVDSLTNAIYAFGPFAMAYSLVGGLGFLQIQFILFSLIFSALHAIGAIMDMNEDKKAGIKTFATEYGARIPALFASFAFLINIPFAFNLMKSASFFVSMYFLLFAYVAFKPTVRNAIRVSKIGMILFFVWFITASFFILTGIDNLNLEILNQN